jgi:hypothetical protein
MPYTPAVDNGQRQPESRKRSPKRYKQAATGNKKGVKSSRPLASGSDFYNGFTKEGKNNNFVEQKYWNGLDGQFDTLLLTLSLAHDANISRNGNEQQERRVSKPEVLIMAKDHTAALEERGTAPKQQKRTLVNNTKDMKAEWVGMDGVKLPSGHGTENKSSKSNSGFSTTYDTSNHPETEKLVLHI